MERGRKPRTQTNQKKAKKQMELTNEDRGNITDNMEDEEKTHGGQSGCGDSSWTERYP